MQATSSYSFQTLEFLNHHNIRLSDPRVHTLQTLSLEADRAQFEMELLARYETPSLEKLITDVLRCWESNVSKEEISRYLATREKAMMEAANQIERISAVRGKLEGLVKMIGKVESELKADADLLLAAQQWQAGRR